MRDSYGRRFSVSPGTSGPSECSIVVSIGGATLSGKGLYALGMPSHEASIIAIKEKAVMKMIEFFIPGKLSFGTASLGFEPRQSDPESLVLPLHHEAMREKIRGDSSRCKSQHARRGRIQATATFCSSSISAPS